MADVSITYDPEVVQLGGATALNVSLVANPGFETTIGAIVMNFEDGTDPEINPPAFHFVDLFQTQNWFTQDSDDGIFPDAQSAKLCKPGAAPPLNDGEHLIIGTLTVEPTALGDWNFASNLTVADSETFLELEIQGGDPTVISVVPEPATAGLLGLAALPLLRRRVGSCRR